MPPTVPIKIELVNSSGINVSSPSIMVQALFVVATPVGTTSPCSSAPSGFNWTTGAPQSCTYMAELAAGGGYQFNVKSTGLSTGPTYQLLFRVAGEDAGSYHTDAGATFTLTKERRPKGRPRPAARAAGTTRFRRPSRVRRVREP